MTRRELCQFVETLREAAGESVRRDKAGRSESDFVLSAVHLAMRRSRGDSAHAADDEAALLPLLDRDDVRSVLDQDDALGQVYQAMNAPALESSYRATSKERRKFSSDEIPAVSQLFTPRWVVEFLLHNTLGRLWLEWHPDTLLCDEMPWLVSAKPVLANAKTRQAATIRVLDPACGTMNFGVVAFELLCRMYQEELDRAGQPGWPPVPSIEHSAHIPAAVLRNNLFGIDIDPMALRLARATLQMKSRVNLPDNQLNVWQADSLFDEKIARRCEGAFDIVVTNPPYVSSRNLAADQVGKMKKRFPAAWRDLYACFIERSLDFACENGRVGLLTMQSFMFTGAYQKLRARIGQRSAIETLAHFGPGLFAIGNPGTLQTAAFVARKECNAARRSAQPLVAYRLTDVPRDEKQDVLQRALKIHGSLQNYGALTSSVCLSGKSSRQTATAFRLPQSALYALPRLTWAYWIDESLRRAFCHFPRLGDIAPPRQGLATTDNFRFVRYWWEVEPIHRDAPAKATEGQWLPYAKSGQFRRWYESPRHRVNWQDDGRDIKQAIIGRYPYLNGQWKWVAKNTSYYGRGGITWSYLTSGRFSARRLEAGSIFDVAGSSLFPSDVPGMLAILNSSAIHRLLEAINPTVNFQVGDLAELPIPETIPGELAALADSAICLQREIDAGDETAPDFTSPPCWENAIERNRLVARKLSFIEHAIDAGVCDLYGLRPEAIAVIDDGVVDRVDLARRWVSFAIGVLLGRWKGRMPGRVLQLDPPDASVVADIRRTLCEYAGESAASEIESELGSLDSFLARDFFPWHVRLYRRRPPLWALRSSGRLYLVAHDCITRDSLAPILRGSGVSLPNGWKRHIDDGIALGLLPFRTLVPDSALGKVLNELFEEEFQGRYSWMAAGNA